MRDIAIYFTTIMLEAIPFLLLGALISAIIEEFVSEERISKMIPKNRVLGSLVGIFLGLFIPACDCAVIPIAMRLKKKKVPTNVIVSFMLASPIISPVVLLSTFFAFGETEKMLLFGFEMPKLFVYRTIFGVLVALVVGIILDIICKDAVLKEETYEHHHHHHDHEHIHTCNHHHEGCSCSHHEKETGPLGRVKNIINIMYGDFMGIISYMAVGALLAATMQILLPISNIGGIVQNKYISTFIMMLLAFALSLCSTSDAFIARTFMNSLSKNSILAFILLGPMIDIKNTILLNKSFNKKFVIVLVASIFITVYLISCLVI
ncbi:MAG: permease [Clostridiales bacterium]|jgi:ABC superfamily ATP binding cassette transporter, membrane protein|nr:permease [Clostridiales bacterium]